MLAHHYQLYEQLPVEKQGGDTGQSLLNDEHVQTTARTYLTSLATGDVTPKKFQHALNEQVLPSLEYTLNVGLLECTARQWLIKLGWQRKALRKGVYMDDHKRINVKKYRNEVFLPLMASLDRRMVHWDVEESEGGNANKRELKRTDLRLGPGEKRIVPIYQDESSFHVNEYKSNVWYAPQT
jgi:hypothetical protein